MAQQKLGNVQWGDLTFGPGTPYAVSVLEGLDDLPDIRTDDLERPGQHGDYTSPDYTAARTITLGLTMVADDPDAYRQLCLDLRAATQPQRTPAALQFTDQDTLVWAKVRRRAIPYDAENLWRTGTAALELYCADPYLYGLDERTQSTTAYSPSAGRTYPLVYAGVPELRNLVLNPSSELDVANIAAYTASGTAPTFAQDTPAFGARWGTKTTLVTYSASATGGARYALGESVAVGTALRASAHVYLPSVSGLSTMQIRYLNGTTVLTSSGVTLPGAGGWTRVEAQYTVAGSACDGIAISLTTTGASSMSLDGVMVAPATGSQPYVDGDQSGCIWDGTAHASMSRRVAGTNRQYGTPGTSGQLTATNQGAAPAYPVLRVDGPVANPSIEQTNTGSQIVIDATLQTGEYLLIDTRSRAVLFNGETPRRSWVRAGSTWPLLMPGDNDFVYRGAALPGSPGQTSLLTVTWRDTSL
jgi:hypothetical protein